eukprot:TRINITY_DN14473_c0_g1_i1.p1 TRINITY_DN14473_c0_g1~~TRINITY_DN14473_c0_g1_i1.p1  ORF type:complete len:207 (+),score=23.96 TRINITY_DN14473_c0_g1_i1:51-671(+)
MTEQDFKIVLVGDSRVGKTAFIHTFMRQPNESYSETKKIEMHQYSIELNGLPRKVRIWDTPGNEYFRNLNSGFYRGTNGIILMYNNDNLDSVMRLEEWLSHISYQTHATSILVIRNSEKLESLKSHEVSKHGNYPLIELSAKNTSSVDFAIGELLSMIIDRKIQLDESFTASSSSSFSSRISSDSSKLVEASSTFQAQTCCQCILI